MPLLSILLFSSLPFGPGSETPEARATAYLSREVPRWSRENKCFSCHNNADGARALYLAGLKSSPILEETNAWLATPERWSKNGGDGPFSDKRLAQIQFAAALADAWEIGAVKEKAPLVEIAAKLAKDQAEDGSWAPDGPDALGSAATLGKPLSTWTVRQVLARADAPRFKSEIAKADAFLAKLTPRTTLDAAVILLSKATSDGLKKATLAKLLAAQSETGGWGPFPDDPAEVFDTARVVIALLPVQEKAAVEAVAKGRAHLIKTQNQDGSWPETTRPSGGESYAQRVSTAGWATRALLLTKPKR